MCPSWLSVTSKQTPALIHNPLRINVIIPKLKTPLPPMPAETNEPRLEEIRMEIEKVMLTLCPEKTVQDHRLYLAGYIDCLADKSHISENEREILYAEYAF